MITKDVFEEIPELFYFQDYSISIDSVDDLPSIKHNPLFIKFYAETPYLQKVFSIVLDKYLKFFELLNIKNSVQKILTELIHNAIKANLKRFYFTQSELDINDEQKYDEGMKNFKNDILGKIDLHSYYLKENDLPVDVVFTFDRTKLNITIRNKFQALPCELARIEESKTTALKSDAITSILLNETDESEGLGIGISSSLFLLKNEGISPESFSAKNTPEGLVISYDIPFRPQKPETAKDKARKIIEDIEVLPTFPQNIKELIYLVNNPESTFEQIATKVQKDVFLSANVMKLANSAAFSQQSKVETVQKALQLIGLKEFRNILYILGTKNIMEDKYAAFEEIWERSNECAFIVRQLAERKHYKNTVTTTLVSMALLYDIGQVIVLSCEPEIKDISKTAAAKNIHSPTALEEIALGITHTEAGAMVAEKWNFPKHYKIVAKYHHKPLTADEKDFPYLFPIYLSDMLISITTGLATVAQVHSEVMDYFSFENYEQLMAFAKDVKREYVKFVSNKL